MTLHRFAGANSALAVWVESINQRAAGTLEYLQSVFAAERAR
jgi:hypothetical protein